MDLISYQHGLVFDAYDYFGAHKVTPEDVAADAASDDASGSAEGYAFRVYAPNALYVTLVGEFSNWEEVAMERKEGGIHTCTVPEARCGQMYKFRIHTNEGFIDHCDPYGRQMQLRPDNASIITSEEEFDFHDEAWMAGQKPFAHFNKPMNIYEIHLGSWKKKTDDEGNESWFTYREIAEMLIPYLHETAYNYVEFMPLAEHPSDESWGYQTTGYFAPTSRYGTPEDLKFLIDSLHCNGIGVIMDFVPVHFARDGYGLKNFDGTCLYEYPHKDVGESEWGSMNFMHAHGDVRSFLNSAADYWLTQFHCDGLRMDAVSRIIYWNGDPKRGINNEGTGFLKVLNQGLRQRHPGAFLIAEDSTDYIKVTAPVEYDGLGFDYKWDLGWMNDTLSFLSLPPEKRPLAYSKLTFSMMYFYRENYVLPLSHDENVHGKHTIVDKMWGSYDQKFAQAKVLYGYMMTHPGKKLDFMANEIGQIREWDEKRSQDWDLLKYPVHDSFRRYRRDLNKIYLAFPALYEGDFNSGNFKWLVVNDPENSVYAYSRNSDEGGIIAVFNLSDKNLPEYTFEIEKGWMPVEMINSAWDIYGGSPQPHILEIYKNTMKIDLRPFSFRLFRF